MSVTVNPTMDGVTPSPLPPFDGFTDATGTPGNATISTQRGRVQIANTTSTVTVTNANVSATSQVFTSLVTSNGALNAIKTAVAGSGSFTITGNANAGIGGCNVDFFVVY